MDSHFSKITFGNKLSKPFPLRYLMLLYLKNPKEFRINYFEGFKLTVGWMLPIDIPDEAKPRLPDIFRTWEIMEIARILHDIDYPAPQLNISRLRHIENVIYHLLLEIYGYQPTYS